MNDKFILFLQYNSVHLQKLFSISVSQVIGGHAVSGTQFPVSQVHKNSSDFFQSIENSINMSQERLADSNTSLFQ